MKNKFKSKSLPGVSKEDLTKASISGNASYAASCVSKENRIKNGKKAGATNVKTGHIQTLNDYPRDENQRSEAGKLGGAKNVETGWILESQPIATAAATAKLMVKKLDEIKVLNTTMESDKLYSYANLVTIVTHVKDRRLWVLLRCEEARPYIKIEKQGRFTFYKKIETKFK